MKKYQDGLIIVTGSDPRGSEKHTQRALDMSYRIDRRFSDRSGRLISFQVDDDIIAHVQGKEIGHLQFDFEEFTHHPYLFHIAVEAPYSRAGIGTEMVRLAAELHGRKFGRPSFFELGGLEKSSSDYFTQDGAALFQHCIRMGIIDDIPETRESHEDDWEV
ncbi:MAG: N-acetyltransferase [Pseudoxanthomonas spadix]|nr:MAG: N-acetyltransferase [Pseudoxanthomonas spadix]